MSNTSTSWHETSTAKAITYILGVIGGLFVIVQIVQFFLSPRTALTATYYTAPISIPTRLQERGALDSAVLQMDTIAKRLYYAYYEKLTFAERVHIPDSLSLPQLPKAYYYAYTGKQFARSYRYFGKLHVQNDGDKALSALQVLHGADAYYEFKDSNGHLQSGTSATRFAIGELVAGESRDIYLWTGLTFKTDETITITYPEGRVQTARAEVVTGFLAWLARYSDSIFVLFAMLSGSAIFTLIYYLYAKFQYRSQVKRNTEQIDRLIDPNK